MTTAANVIYILTILLYSISVLGYFIDFIQNNRKVNRIAFWLLSIVWVLQTLFFVIRAIAFDRVPVITPFEGLFLFAWLVVTLSLVLNFFFRIDFLILFTNIIGFIMLAFSLFVPSGDVPEELTNLLVSELLIIHITFVLLSYAGFTLAFAFSSMYAIQNRMLKQKAWSSRLTRFGSLPRLEKLAFASTVLAYPFLLLGVILGFVWAYIQLPVLPWFDAKVLGSLLILIVYGIYMYERAVRNRRGYSLALLNLAGFLLVLINYFLSDELTEFHFWY
ncbi:HemX family protein [Salsuginibacillus halophilus]|uniref:HemX family protein n=2 Tax=Salsuginibacillus halophilus TaxID=517424 RepID=A0A2P8HCP4_9BACI|nr:cytochrome c biogenesis protein CcsA [Salsuginibacillus halophilus]PSL43999.1 HemX family protein [Salsuginibacillus halophilus]